MTAPQRANSPRAAWIAEGRQRLAAEHPYSTLADGCKGDSAGLAEALGDHYEVIYECRSDEGWGHHSYNAVFRIPDGRYIHAECGGCSCGGYGSWSYCADEREALLLVPEQERDAMPVRRRPYVIPGDDPGLDDVLADALILAWERLGGGR